MKYQRLENELLTGEYTEVWHDEPEFNAPHVFVVTEADKEANELSTVTFQKGPIKEYGVNGVHNEDLLAMVLCRLKHFQNSPFACRENALAITAIEEAMLRLRQRTMGREKRGVLGTYEK
jgi:hypothetical protein